MGKNAPDNHEEAYTFQQYYVYLHFQRKLKDRIFLGLLYEYQRLLGVDYQPGGLFDQLAVPGRYPYHISGAGLSLPYGSRNNAFAPDKGGFFQVFFNHFSPAFGSNFQYTNYVIDFRRSIRLYRQQVLAIQAYGFFNSGDVPCGVWPVLADRTICVDFTTAVTEAELSVVANTSTTTLSSAVFLCCPNQKGQTSYQASRVGR